MHTNPVFNYISNNKLIIFVGTKWTTYGVAFRAGTTQFGRTGGDGICSRFFDISIIPRNPPRQIVNFENSERHRVWEPFPQRPPGERSLGNARKDLPTPARRMGRQVFCSIHKLSFFSKTPLTIFGSLFFVFLVNADKKTKFYTFFLTKWNVFFNDVNVII